MIFYVLLVATLSCLFLFSCRYPSTEKSISFILLGIMVLIGGFRDRIGWDYDGYVNWYTNGTRDDGLEFGFLVIMKVFRYFNLSYYFLFFFISFLTYFFTYLGIRKYTKNYCLPLVISVLVPIIFIGSFSMIRQSLSIAIAFYAFNHLLERKYISYISLMMAGMSIHYSCLIPFVVFFILYKWGEFVRVRHLYILMGLTFVIGQIGIIHWLSFFLKDSHYHYYVSSQYSSPVSLFKVVAKNLIFLFVIYYYDMNRLQYSNQKYLLQLYVCSILFLNLFSESTNLTRVSFYFIIFEIIVVSEIMHDAILKRRFYLLGMICCFYLFLYFRAIQIDYKTAPENLRLVPYKTLLFK